MNHAVILSRCLPGQGLTMGFGVLHFLRIKTCCIHSTIIHCSGFGSTCCLVYIPSPSSSASLSWSPGALQKKFSTRVDRDARSRLLKLLVKPSSTKWLKARAMPSACSAIVIAGLHRRFAFLAMKCGCDGLVFVAKLTVSMVMHVYRIRVPFTRPDTWSAYHADREPSAQL